MFTPERRLPTPGQRGPVCVSISRGDGPDAAYVVACGLVPEPEPKVLLY